MSYEHELRRCINEQKLALSKLMNEITELYSVHPDGSTEISQLQQNYNFHMGRLTMAEDLLNQLITN